MVTTIEVRVPDIGDFKGIPVVEILVQPGECVQEQQPVVTLESDKAALDVPTPVAGRVTSLEVAQGSRVSEGSLILTLEPLGDAQLPAAPPPDVAARDPSDTKVVPLAKAARVPVDNAVPLAPAENGTVQSAAVVLPTS